MIKVIKDSVCTLRDYTQEEKEIIMNSLTYVNPEYENAKRYSRWGTNISLSPYKIYYIDAGDYLVVPRGYKIPFSHRIIVDDTLKNEGVEYPKLKIKLREVQKNAVKSYIDKLHFSRDYGVICVPTGMGKSIIGISLAQILRQRCLVIVQKDDLIDGWLADCRLALGLRPRQVGLIKAKEYRLGKWITLTTIQTLSKLDTEKLTELYKYFGIVIVDEFHRSVAKTYTLINCFPAKFRIGLTATPFRNDGLEGVLYHYFGGIAYKYEEKIGEKDEDIMGVTIKVKPIKQTVWLPPPKTRLNRDTGEMELVPLKISDIRKAIAYNLHFNAVLIDDILQEYKNKKSCIVFCHEKEHCKNIYETLIENGVAKNHLQIYSSDNREPKSIIKKRAENKEVLITIATFAIATEGTNVKAWERGFLASTIANKKDLIQTIGRLRRRKAGKKDVVVYDYRFPNVAGARKHGDIRDNVYDEFRFKVIS